MARDAHLQTPEKQTRKTIGGGLLARKSMNGSFIHTSTYKKSRKKVGHTHEGGVSLQR